jgi:mannose-6-phosphate isomerase-like protein (cupin superfamily)
MCWLVFKMNNVFTYLKTFRMKRNIFWKVCLTAVAAVTTPFSLLGNFRSAERVDKGFKVESGKDRFNKSISLFEGDTFDCKISSSDTEGDIYVYESIRRKNGGPAEHVHFNQDEWWYVLSGEFIIKVGEETFHAKAGDSVFGPRKIPHVWAKVNDGEGRLLMIFQPAGKMEEYFTAVSEGVLAKMSSDEQKEFRKKHGFERTGSALGYLKQ